MKDKLRVSYRQSDENGSYKSFVSHSHDTFEIYFFHSGDCKYHIGDRIHQLLPNDLILMNGLTLHGATPSPHVPYIRSVLQFSQPWIMPILEAHQVPELLSPFNHLNNFLFREIPNGVLQEIDQLFSDITTLYTSPPNVVSQPDEEGIRERLYEGRLSTLLVQLLFTIHSLSHAKLEMLPPQESERHKHVDAAAAWVQNYFQRPISLNDMASSLNISKYHMCRTFKEVTGMTIMKYLMSVRVNRAKYLLEMDPSKSILDVTLESGFENASHFSRAFRQHANMTPSQYRKRWQRQDMMKS
ncbi:AraC family transcriptional regulator [Aureibacillus halotolerans]|uniref:AraC-like protein n=1 Tax=Aureibacillus halotolerans TaxID=1508390 RepID=A0A4R6TRN1_9BACI|nr:helix-turn-helix domain-containing protein [Aureibacillus halotolerans]TDQ36238.1 AraC-like protein [Aureibacillus halotolerans]